MTEYGLDPALLPEKSKGIPARITAVHRERYEAVCERGRVFARLKTKEYYGENRQFPTTGDFVLLDWQEHGDSRIVETLPRKTCFSRRDPYPGGYREQAVAANFDMVCVVQSLNQDFNPRRLERYLALAWQSGAVPAVILTKADLTSHLEEQLRETESLASGAAVLAVSSKTGYGMEELMALLEPGCTVVFLGSSGVGKSSLVNALAGREIMDVGGIREYDGKGRHTTTYRQLVRLPSGVLVIDTPGMRELGMWEAAEGLGKSFEDVEKLFKECRFRDCRHENEPGCAVKAAIREGGLSWERWESYRQLQKESRSAVGKSPRRQEKQRRNQGSGKSRNGRRD